MNYNQRDPRWKDLILGFGTTQTIGMFGCTITSIANILGVTPDVVNDRLKAVSGFSGALVIWAKLAEAFPGVKFTRVWTYNNDDVLAHVPNVIVEVPANAIGGTGKHWVQFIGNHMCRDPWTGTERPVSDFTKFGDPTGYCIVDGTWNKPSPQTDYQKLYEAEKAIKDQQYEQLQEALHKAAELQDKLTASTKEVDRLNEHNKDLENELSKANDQAKSYADEIAKIHNDDSNLALRNKELGDKVQSQALELSQISLDLNVTPYDFLEVRSAIDKLKMPVERQIKPIIENERALYEFVFEKGYGIYKTARKQSKGFWDKLWEALR